MKERTSAYLTIYDSDGTALTLADGTTLSVPITASSKRVVKLMESDYIQLDFTLAEAVFIPIGAYVDDEIFGRFCVTEEQMPKYDTATGGYKYELKMDAWYYLWNRKYCMLTTTLVEGSTLTRKETSWYLTHNLKNQVLEVLHNLIVIGAIDNTSGMTDEELLETYCDIETEDIPKVNEALNMTYSGIYILDALKSIADTWECEYWITGTRDSFIIHFGKCESGDAIDLTYGSDTEQGNIESMDISKDTSDYANKLYVFGSTENLPTTYRKVAKLTVDTVTDEYYCTFKEGDVTPSMLPFSDNLALSIYNIYNSEDDIFSYSSGKMLVGTIAKSPIDESFPQYRTKFKNIKTAGYSFYLDIKKMLSAGDLTNIVQDKDESKGIEEIAGDTWVIYLTIEMNVIEYAGSIPTTVMFKEQIDLYETMTDENKFTVIVPEYSFADNRTLDYSIISVNDIYNKLEYTVKIQVSPALKNGEKYQVRNPLAGKAEVLVTSEYITMPNDIQIGGDAGFSSEYEFNNSWNTSRPVKATWKESGEKKTGYLIVNVDKNTESADYKKSVFVEDYTASPLTMIEVPESTEITLDAEDEYDLPTAFYVDEYDNEASLMRIGDNRLRVPNDSTLIGEDGYIDGTAYGFEGLKCSPNGYIMTSEKIDKPNADDVVELAVSFDNIYPDGKLKVASVTTEDKQTVTEYSGESEKTTWQWQQYHLTLRTQNETEFKFNKKYILSGETLKIRFLIPEDVKSYYEDTEITHEDDDTYTALANNCKLAGMTFECEYNVSTSYKEHGADSYTTHSRDYAIVRNSDYGAKLPNDVLRPALYDPCVLVNWNVKALSDLGLIAEAELRLLKKGFEYFSALKDGNFTFTCNMMSDFMFDLYGNYVNAFVSVYDDKPIYDSEGTQLFSQDSGALNVEATIPSAYLQTYEAENKMLFVRNNNDAFAVPMLGHKVNIIHAALKDGSKETRIIGMELKLDKPYDTPKIICGETEAYSRLKQLEKEITKLSN